MPKQHREAEIFRKPWMRLMRCLSIRHPWAWLICAGKKTIENHVWQTPYRGTIAIHASTTKSVVSRVREIREAYYTGLMTLARELELPDADLADSPTRLLDEHMIAVTALVAMDKSKLGAIL